MGKVKELYLAKMEAAYEQGYLDYKNRRNYNPNPQYTRDEKGAYSDGYEHAFEDFHAYS